MSEATPEQLIRRVAVGETTFTLLGTAHVSSASVADVEREVGSGRYDAVAVELCDSRYRTLTQPDSLERMDLFQILREGKAGMVAASLALGAYQQRLAEQFGIRPGAEMEAAARGARQSGYPVWLIDREIGTTLKRVYRRVPWWQRAALLSGLLASTLSRERIEAEDIERLKQGDMLESTFAEFAERSAVLYDSLIAERDRYMAARLLEEARSGAREVLAVVGAGHLAGIAAALEQGIEDPVGVQRELDRVPPGARWPRVIPWVVVAVILGGFAIGFSRSTELGLQLVLDWVLINGGLCALGALLAAAHPLTVITSFLAAPLTSLNPTIGAGFVAAGAELALRRPQVRDFRRLRTDVTRARGWWHNRVSRTLLVFLFTTIGSAAGTYLAGFRILGQLV
ncbi:TraB/GumN family protein [Spiribacter halobius]|uniref:Conjugal transfer protein TraB n=1 Tax=Sediminicurvatus halobius TaxID=2182432 RepID=A0A2U2N2N9_9GAMM|nr:TraB/GumN family protein [Spiribacter halobius]PWG63249.1 conjugal transfer protein TraB [Spiribacter halobius]UEX76680.1 TraB/GumN family protein [Spiribacter halobius]